MRSRWLGLAWLVQVLALTGAGIAQNSAVLMPVTVTGPTGEAPSTLEKESISVLDNGKTEPVSAATLVRPASRGGLTIFALDTMHSSVVEDPRLRQEIIQAVTYAAERNDPVLLMTWNTRGMRVIHHHQTPIATLQAALKQLAAAPPSGKVSAAELASPIWRGGPDDNVDREAQRLALFIRGVDANVNFNALLILQMGQAMDFLHQTAQTTARFQGRKKLIWITNELPFELEGNGRMSALPIYQTVSEDQAGNSELHMNDKQELLTDQELKSIQKTWSVTLQAMESAALSVYPVEAANSRSLGARSRIIASFRALADDTGGKAVVGQNDLTGPMKSIVGETGAYYAVNFSADKSRNGWHKLAVRVSGGSTVQAPSGFFDSAPPHLLMAQAPAGATSPGGTDSMLQELYKLADSADVNFKLTVLPSAKTEVQFEMPADAIRLDTKDGNHVHIQFLAAAFNAQGEAVSQASQAIDTKIPEQALPQVKEFGYRMRLKLDTPQGEYTIKGVVKDELLKKRGIKSAAASVK